MVIVYDTYSVAWKLGDVVHVLRVPQPDVERILSVLLFNRATEIVAKIEPRGVTGESAVSSA